jgi:hypothetical protein
MCHPITYVQNVDRICQRTTPESSNTIFRTISIVCTTLPSVYLPLLIVSSEYNNIYIETKLSTQGLDAFAARE